MLGSQGKESGCASDAAEVSAYGFGMRIRVDAQRLFITFFHDTGMQAAFVEALSGG
jgi:hypothetical protein